MAKFPWDPSEIQRAVVEFRRFNDELMKAADSSQQTWRAIQSLKLPDIDYAYLASTDRLIEQVVRERHAMEGAVRSLSGQLSSYQTVWESVTKTAAFDASRWLRDLDTSSVLKAAKAIAVDWQPLLSASAFAHVATDAQKLRSLAQSHRDVILETQGPLARRLALEEYVRAGFEVIVGASSRPTTPVEEFKWRLALLWYFCTLLVTVNSCYQSGRQSADAADRRVVEREHAQSISSLTEAVRQLRADIDLLSPEPGVKLRVTQPGILREGPSSQTPRVARLKTGQRLRLITRYQRWLFVEVINSSGARNGSRGWLYRRVVGGAKGR